MSIWIDKTPNDTTLPMQELLYLSDLDLYDKLCIIDIAKDILNSINNDLQQHIRSNKDKENQKIVDELIEIAKTEVSTWTKGLVNVPTSYTKAWITQFLEINTGKDIKYL